MGSGAGGTYDTTGLGGWGGDFGVGGGFDEDGAAGSGGDQGDANCASGTASEFYLSDLNWIGTATNTTLVGSPGWNVNSPDDATESLLAVAVPAGVA